MATTLPLSGRGGVSIDWSRNIANGLKDNILGVISGYELIDCEQEAQLIKERVRDVKHLIDTGGLDENEAELFLRYLIAELIHNRTLQIADKFMYRKVSKHQACQLLSTIT